MFTVGLNVIRNVKLGETIVSVSTVRNVRQPSQRDSTVPYVPFGASADHSLDLLRDERLPGIFSIASVSLRCVVVTDTVGDGLVVIESRSECSTVTDN